MVSSTVYDIIVTKLEGTHLSANLRPSQFLTHLLNFSANTNELSFVLCVQQWQKFVQNQPDQIGQHNGLCAWHPRTVYSMGNIWTHLYDIYNDTSH